MIPTPEFAVNPLSWKETATFDPGDGIPIEKASGFGRHIKRDAIKRGIVMDYVEVSGNITIDVTSRNSDLYVKIIGSSVGTVTIYGQLPAGNTLYIDPITRGCNAVVGGVTYNLTGARRGVTAFHSTGSAWSVPSQTVHNIEVRNDLEVKGDFVLGDSFVPGTARVFYSTILAPGKTAVIPRGIIDIPNTIGRNVPCPLEQWVTQSSMWYPVAFFPTLEGATAYLTYRVTIFSTGSNYRYYNRRDVNISLNYYKH